MKKSHKLVTNRCHLGQTVLCVSKSKKKKKERKEIKNRSNFNKARFLASYVLQEVTGGENRQIAPDGLYWPAVWLWGRSGAYKVVLAVFCGERLWSALRFLRRLSLKGNIDVVKKNNTVPMYYE